ncbi:M3 family metallopeptidase [Paraglaciecola sp. L3A3]|uniref:M3 family metallopeptidase n=1 Tax=Paraglaciecola sp. L3A3 TaxID=2686358 RepID=UPI00131B39B1|nr:M3 family metallopeptidase [Paraglaciecola sp. L3A3]
MRITLVAATIFSALAVSGCSSDESKLKTNPPTEKQAAMSDNILFSQSPLQYQAPQFDKLKITDYEPAFTQGMQDHSTEIEAIANNPQSPSFENTLVAMEKSGALLDRVSRAFFSLSSLISDEEYQRIEADMAPKLSAHSDNIYLNAKLFSRISTIHQQLANFSAEDQRLISYYYDQFVRAGARLSETEKNKMRDINSQLSTLSTEFSQNILQSFKNDVILVTDKSELAGLSESDIASLAAAAKDADKTGYMVTLVNTTRQPILSKLENRELREKIWKASANRAKDTNTPILAKLAQLRADKASLLGFKNWASYIASDQMALTPDAIYTMLDDLAPKALLKAKDEAADIQAQIKAQGHAFTMQPWDWAFYGEQVRQAKYDLDEDQIKPYFEYHTVLKDGLFFAMEKLYGITFKTRKDLPVYHPDVSTYEVFNEDGSSIGLFYLDPYAREGKRGGAWMSSYITQNHLQNNKPVIYNALNIPKPATGQPTLMTFDEVTTLFHEFGHAAHGLFSDVKYPSLAGTATARDFVEFPSQFNEDWAIEPSVIANYAKHYQTGEPIPKTLLTKTLNALKFNQGFDTTEYLASALLDMEWHSISPDTEIKDAGEFETNALAKHGLDYAAVPPRYKSAYFSHVFAGGYSASYYAYIWTEVYAADAFAYVQENGGLTRKNGEAYRKTVLSMGNSQDLMTSYINFRGQQPIVEPLLKRRGLLD